MTFNIVRYFNNFVFYDLTQYNVYLFLYMF